MRTPVDSAAVPRHPDVVLRSATALRTLERRDRDAILAAAAPATPSPNVLVAERVELVGSEPVRLGGEIWGLFEHGVLEAPAAPGANLVPVGCARPAAMDAFAEPRPARRPALLLARSATPTRSPALWRRLEPMGGAAREVRAQPAALQHPSAPRGRTPDPLVRARCPRTSWIAVLPACVAMFTEEVGYSPVGGDGGLRYRRRVADLRQGRTLRAAGPGGRGDLQGRLGSVSSQVAQVQGVWVDPRWRGQGLAAPAMAAVVQAALRDVAPDRVALRQRLQRPRHRGLRAGRRSSASAPSRRSSSERSPGPAGPLPTDK